MCAIIEENGYTAAGQLIAKAKLVGVINPLADPHQRLWLCQWGWVLFSCYGRGGNEGFSPASGSKRTCQTIPMHQSPALPGGMKATQFLNAQRADSTTVATVKPSSNPEGNRALTFQQEPSWAQVMSLSQLLPSGPWSPPQQPLAPLIFWLLTISTACQCPTG